MRAWLIRGCLLAALYVFGSAGAAADTPGAVQEWVEVSMVVTGAIDIAPDGTVLGYHLDKPDALPEGVKGLAAKSVPLWHFEPVLVDGKAVQARTFVNMRFVAKKREDGSYSLEIRSATFSGAPGKPGEMIVAKSMRPPRFPFGARLSGIKGTTYVVLRIGRSGTVEDAAVERVNLRVVRSDMQMRQGRQMLAEASLAAARKWTFTIPTSGPEAGKEHWMVRVPVSYLFNGEKPPEYGQWQAYVPGPYQRAPWVESGTGEGSDALVAGGIYPVGAGPTLLTRLGGESAG